MALFGFGKADPSREWGEQRTMPVVLDLRQPSICGIALGQPAVELARFGKPSNRGPFKAERFEYESMGIEIEIDGDFVSYFGLIVVRMDTDHVGGCRPTVICPDGASMSIEPGSDVKSLLAHCPAPREVDEDNEDEAVYFIPLADRVMFEIEASKHRQVRRLNVYRAE